MNSEIVEQLNNLKSSIEHHHGLSQNSSALAFEIQSNEQEKNHKKTGMENLKYKDMWDSLKHALKNGKWLDKDTIEGVLTAIDNIEYEANRR